MRLSLIVGLSTVALTLLTNSSRTDHRAGTEGPALQRISQATPQMNQKFEPLKYLPSGSNITNADKHIVFADLDGDGNKEITIFYSLWNTFTPRIPCRQRQGQPGASKLAR